MLAARAGVAQHVGIDDVDRCPGGVGVEIERKRAKEQHSSLDTSALSAHEDVAGTGKKGVTS